MAGPFQRDAVLARSPQQILFEARNVDMTVLGDTVMIKVFSGSLYRCISGVALRKTGAFNTTCNASIGNAAAGAATLYVNSVNLTSLTGANSIQALTIVNNTVLSYTTVPVYLDVLATNGAALTADFFVYGFVLD